MVRKNIWSISIQQMLLNLLTNAIKFTPKGKISLEVKKVETGIKFTVIDTGIGIADHQIPHLFERFRQAEGSENRSYEGTGLGLALVKELVEEGFEVRPIVTGNFAKNEVMKYFDYTIHDQLKNSDYIDAHGLFIGNHHYSIASAVDALTSLWFKAGFNSKELF